MVTIYKRQFLDKNHLNIYITDDDGIYFDPFYIRYTIFRRKLSYITQNTISFQLDEEPILETINSIPITFGIGKYYAAWNMPSDIEIGDFRIKWMIQKYVDSQKFMEEEEFQLLIKPDKIIQARLMQQYGKGNDIFTLPHTQFDGGCAG